MDDFINRYLHKNDIVWLRLAGVKCNEMYLLQTNVASSKCSLGRLKLMKYANLTCAQVSKIMVYYAKHRQYGEIAQLLKEGYDLSDKVLATCVRNVDDFYMYETLLKDHRSYLHRSRVSETDIKNMIELKKPWTSNVGIMAAMFGNLKALEMVLGDSDSINYEIYMAAAIIGGHSNTVEWLAHFCYFRFEIFIPIIFYKKLFSRLKITGKYWGIDSLQYLSKLYITHDIRSDEVVDEEDIITFIDPMLINLMIMTNRFDEVRHMAMNLPINANTLSWAAFYGNIEMLEILYFCDTINVGNLFQFAISGNQLKVLKWAKVMGMVPPGDMMDYTIMRADLNIIKWMHKQTDGDINPVNSIPGLCHCRKWPIIKWMKSHTEPINYAHHVVKTGNFEQVKKLVEWEDMSIFDDAAIGSGNLRLVKYVVKDKIEHIVPTLGIIKYFKEQVNLDTQCIWAVVRGRLDILNYLKKINYIFNNCDLLHLAAASDRVKTVKWVKENTDCRIEKPQKYHRIIRRLVF